MSHLLAVPALLRGLPGCALGWPVASQQVARRNAMLACTALAARRAERDDVTAYLDSLSPRPARPARVPALPAPA